MAVWPFGRRPRRHSSVVMEEEKVIEPAVLNQSVNQSATVLPTRRMSKGSSIHLPWRRASVAKSTDGRGFHSATLKPIVPTSPLEAAFEARAETPDSQASAEHITALPQSRILKTSPHLRPAVRDNADLPYDFRLQSSTSRVGTPTVSKPSHGSRKLSKSSANKFGMSVRDSVHQPQEIKEEELRAMSGPGVASRPVARHDSGILRRDSKKVRDGLTLSLQKRESRISLPRPDTGIASLIGQPDARLYRISIMDIMSPRPVMKSTEPYSMLTLGVTDSRLPSRRQMTANASEFGRRSRRVNELADNLDSTGLRAAMEREQRRKEKKKQSDAERLQRRLERRAQEQQDDDSEPPLPSAAETHAALAHAAKGVAVSRKLSRRRRKDQSRRRSSSASRPDTGRRLRQDEPVPDLPVPSSPDANIDSSVQASLLHQWPQRSDSRMAPSAPSQNDKKIPATAALASSTAVINERPFTPSSRRWDDDDGVLTPDRILPEEDPDEAAPPSIARHRHPKHEMAHVAHLYSQDDDDAASVKAVEHEDKTVAVPREVLAPETPSVAASEAASDAEPVLDVMAIDPPAIFAPLETDDSMHDTLSLRSPDNEQQRASPLMPTDADDIPGLPFISSTGSDSESPVGSPFAASFPTTFPETEFAAPAPTVHRDPLMVRETLYSSLPPTTPDHPYESSSSITALPTLPSKQETQTEKSKRKRGPSMILSFFRRGDKRHSRARSSSDTTAIPSDPPAAFSPTVQHELIAKHFDESELYETEPAHVSSSPQKPSLGTLVRSQSRFKEDFSGAYRTRPSNNRPLSPPDSRIHSPYNQISPNTPDYMHGAIITPVSHPRHSTQSTSAAQRDEERRRSKSLNRMSNPLSKSMASIDSEGSWLTGKPVRGDSTRSKQLRNLASELHRAPSDAYSRRNVFQGAYSSTSEENLDKIGAVDHFGLQPGRTLHSRHGPDDDYTDASAQGFAMVPSHMASSEIIVRSVTRDGSDNVGASMNLSADISAKVPEIRPGVRVKSSQGMLKEHLSNSTTAHKLSLLEKEPSDSEESSENIAYEKEKIEISPAAIHDGVADLEVGAEPKALVLSNAKSRPLAHDITQ